jgi:hypothetical protein
MAWTVETAKAAETTFALGLLDAVSERVFAVATAIMDKGYDNGPIHDGCMDRNISPVTPLRKTPSVVRVDPSRASASTASGRSREPTTSGRQRSGGAQPASASRSRCGSRQTGCTRSSRVTPRGRARSTRAVERLSGSSGRLKHEWSLLPLRVGGRDRVRLHAELMILAKLGCALAKTRVVPVGV